MVFSSELFIFGFLPCFLASYYLVPKKMEKFAYSFGKLVFLFMGGPEIHPDRITILMVRLPFESHDT